MGYLFCIEFLFVLCIKFHDMTNTGNDRCFKIINSGVILIKREV